MYSTYTTGLTRHIFCIRYEKKSIIPGITSCSSLQYIISKSAKKSLISKSWRGEGGPKEEEKGKKKRDKIVENCEM